MCTTIYIHISYTKFQVIHITINQLTEIRRQRNTLGGNCKSMDKWAIPRVRLVRMARLWKRLSYQVLRCFWRNQNFQIRTRWTRKPAWWANIISWLGGALLISISRNLFEPYWLRDLELTLCMRERFRLSVKQALSTNSCYRADECPLLNMASKLNRDESDSSPVDSKPACQPQRVQQFGDVSLSKSKAMTTSYRHLTVEKWTAQRNRVTSSPAGKRSNLASKPAPACRRLPGYGRSWGGGTQFVRKSKRLRVLSLPLCMKRDDS